MEIEKMREKLIFDYFHSWLVKDASVLEVVFVPDICYIESYGPAYRGLAQVKQWFHDWNLLDKVLQWDIKRYIHQGDVCVCEWFFKCACGGEVHKFDGVSIIEFNSDGKIVWLKEFKSEIPNVYPYEKSN